MRLILSFTRKKLILLLKTVPILVLFTFLWTQFRETGPNGLNGDEYFGDQATYSAPSVLPFTLAELGELIKMSNERQLISHEASFGPLSSHDAVLVIQVHNRGQYLLALIESLRKVKGIEKCLVIFSHDLFDTRINTIVENINFCKVLQVFYPFSLQLFPKSFPGTDVNDCPRDLTREEATKKNCINADFPDTYGHYREAEYTQTKHHWFWKTNFVLDGLRATRNHTGQFVFLEEDHYAAPDLLDVLSKMVTFRQQQCPTCDMLTLGIYAKSVNYAKNGNKIEIHKWISSRHNMAMVLNRQVWTKLRACADMFCKYDDYNWDWSLQQVSLKCLKEPLQTLAVAAPRVFHIGECGVHHKGKHCFDNTMVKKVEQTLAASQTYLFPAKLELQKAPKRSFKMPKVNGGWGDKRDYLLCLNHVIGNEPKLGSHDSG